MLALIILSLLPISQGFLFTKQVCYGKYGCFSNGRPFNNARGALPKSPAAVGVEFLLYTRSNTGHAQTLKDGDANSVHQSHFNAGHPIKLLIHGFTDNGRTSWITKMTKEILAHEDANVIAVNWQKGAAGPNYYQAAANTRLVGAIIAELLKTLHSAGAPNSRVHLIGHSLGSHISGYAGEIIHGLGRITGLDPAGPSFENYDPKTRLDPSDAVFVDAIHTDAESLLHLGFGLKKAIADADFYPNGGKNQPGCPANHGDHLFSLIKGGISGGGNGVGCSHSRAVEFFTSSINTHCSYTAYPCPNIDHSEGCTSCGSHGCSHMGYHASPSKHGNYFLTTSDRAPYYCCELKILRATWSDKYLTRNLRCSSSDGTWR